MPVWLSRQVNPRAPTGTGHKVSVAAPCAQVQTHTVVVEVLREAAASQLRRRLSGGSVGSGADGSPPGSGYDALPSQVIAFAAPGSPVSSLFVMRWLYMRWLVLGGTVLFAASQLLVPQLSSRSPVAALCSTIGSIHYHVPT